MSSERFPSPQQQMKDYLRKHKKNWNKEASQTTSKSKILSGGNRGNVRSNRTLTSSKTVPRQTIASSSRCQIIRKGKVTIDHLPGEVLHQIFIYFGAHELLVAARVCKQWYSLANDNLLWIKIFQTYVGETSSVHSPHIQGDLPLSYWKTKCIQNCVTRRNKEATKQLKKPDPYTGLPKNTKKVLDQFGIQFEICLLDTSGREHFIPCCDIFTFSMSSLCRFYSLQNISMRDIKQIQLYSINPLFFDRGKAVINSPYQKSLLLDLPLRWENWVKTNRPASSDDLINLHILPPGLMVATWKVDGDLVFISVCLHHNQLIHRCLYGRRDSLYIPQPSKPIADDVDSVYGLHDYSCTVEIHNQRRSIWSQQYRSLHCKPHNIVGGYAVLELIRPGHTTDHSIISEKLTLPWKSQVFKGKLEGVTVLDVTLLDERGKPFWCTSSPVHIHSSGQEGFNFDYTVEGTCKLNFVDPQGKVNMELNWSPEREQYFVTCLQVGVSLKTINDWFGTVYK